MSEENYADPETHLSWNSLGHDSLVGLEVFSYLDGFERSRLRRFNVLFLAYNFYSTMMYCSVVPYEIIKLKSSEWPSMRDSLVHRNSGSCWLGASERP